jgi:hypothetical protein
MPLWRALVATAAAVVLSLIAYTVLLPYAVGGPDRSLSLAVAVSTVLLFYACICLGTERLTRRRLSPPIPLLPSALATLLLAVLLTLAGIFAGLLFRSVATLTTESPAHWELLYRATELTVKLPVRTALPCIVVAVALVFAFARLSLPSPPPARENEA